MTLVIAHKFWKTVAVIADCRVSYGPQCDDRDDYLQKIYQIHSRLVLGFSGPLPGAHRVLQLVKENVCDYRRPPVAHNLQKDVERWIRYEYRQLDEAERKGLTFVVATVEPHRERRSRFFKDGKEIAKPTWFPYEPEWNTLALKPSASDSTKLIAERKRLPKIIGLAGEHRRAVEGVLMQLYGFAFHEPAAQMQVIMNTLKLKLMERQVKEVGGLFQCALLNEQGVQWLGYSAPNVILQPEKGRFVQRNMITGQTLPLMSIWEWAQRKPSPGTFGTFEDPGLSKFIERMQKDGGGMQTDLTSVPGPGGPQDS